MSKMKIVIDNQIVKMCGQDAAKIIQNPLLSHPDHCISFGWSSLLEYLGLGSVFSHLPVFDPTHPFFVACISTLYTNKDKETFFYIYDRLFAENLNQIQALPEINASFLLQAIKKEREKSSFLEVKKVFVPTLVAYEAALLAHTLDTMHDLILYLAWDRMCVCMAHLFNYPSTDPKFINGLDILKECLIESYQHIAQQGRTSPGIYRMLEALFFYQMREENLQKHTDADWILLNQSFPVLKSEDQLADFFYIDEAMIAKDKLKNEEENPAYYLTLDSPDRVHARLALVQYMLEKLKSINHQWNYVLLPKKIVYLDS